MALGPATVDATELDQKVHNMVLLKGAAGLQSYRRDQGTLTLAVALGTA